MNKIKIIIYTLMLSLINNGCSQILEPVSFMGKVNQPLSNSQEDFNVNLKSLTFENAQKANQDPYERKVMRSGTGQKANVFNESDFLNITLPKASNKKNYMIGVGDQLIYSTLNEFLSITSSWPEQTLPKQYLLGVGDVLTFTQQNESSPLNYLSKESAGETLSRLNDTATDYSVIKTEGIIGTDGNILLLGLGNIRANKRSLSDVRTEVRNILIRNGLTPNFQLEITDFKSKKAYLTINNMDHRTIPVNNLPITLREVVLSSGISESSGNYALITLTRGSDKFHITAKKLFNDSLLDIYIQDRDIIEIEMIEKLVKAYNLIVGSQGKILLPDIGSINAVNRTLSELQIEISKKLSTKGLHPQFQLELSEYKSKKAYLNIDNLSTIIVPLRDNNLTLRELILNNSQSIAVRNDALSLFTLTRNGKKYQITGEQILNPATKNIIVQNGDQIALEILNYKPGQVFAVSGSGGATIVPISAKQRETLADVLFVKGGALNNSLAQRSEVYLLRNRNSLSAYHLDAQNVSRLLVAAATELRPNDIIFVADRPIVSFARTLAEINPLRILLRDVQNDNIP